MKAYLKFGGLALSSLLTMSLFMRLFGSGAYGISMGVAALALFEGGAIAWNYVLRDAKHGQRGFAKVGLWFCVLTSVISSGAEIILGTGLWKAPFDVAFVTLIIIVGALAVNLIGIVAVEQADPSTAALNRELDRQARAASEGQRLEDQILEQSLMKAEGRVQEIAGSISDRISGDLRDSVAARLLSQTRVAQPVTSFAVSTPAPQLSAPSADISQWSIYAVTRALNEQYKMPVESAYIAAGILVTGKKPIEISSAQLKARVQRPKTIPKLSPETFEKAREALGLPGHASLSSV